MTRRRFYAPPEAFSPDAKSARLSAEETRHLRDVLRLRSGDEVFVFDGHGNEFRCAIAEIGRTSAQLEVVQPVDAACPESSLCLTLAIALLKADKFDLVIQKAAELGVSRVIPVVTARADVRLKNDGDAERKVIRWQRIALEATKQCGRARLIEIKAPIDFANIITTSSEEVGLRLMFAEREGASLASVITRTQIQDVTALVGPEGGWDSDEIAQARDAGWEIVTLGGRILRAETAAIIAVSLLQHRLGDLK